MTRKKLHPYHSPWKRGVYSLALVLGTVGTGTLGFHFIEHIPYMDAFYLSSMIATAQGPSQPPATTVGKLFACFLAFLSVGAVVAATGFLFGPLLGRLWRIGHQHADQWEKEQFGGR